MDSNKTFDAEIDEMLASNRVIENLVKAGKVKLAAKRLVDEQRALAMEEAVEMKRAETLKNFKDGLGELIGQAAVDLLPLVYEDVSYSPTEVRIFVSGHPVVFSVYHLSTGESLRFSSDEPFQVAGLYCAEPAIDDGEVSHGYVEWTFGPVRTGGQPIERFADLEMALALADERGKLAEDLRKRYALRVTALEIQCGMTTMKAIYELGAEKGVAIQDRELVYEPVEDEGVDLAGELGVLITKLVRAEVARLL